MFDPTKPTALLMGRFQPFHEGHKELAMRAIQRVGQVLIAVKGPGVRDERHPFTYAEVCERVHSMLDPQFPYALIALPNIADVVYGRDVGYTFTCEELPQELRAIRGRDLRHTCDVCNRPFVEGQTGEHNICQECLQ